MSTQEIATRLEVVSVVDAPVVVCPDELVVAPASMNELALGLLVITTTGRRPPDVLLDSISEFYKSQLFGVVAYLENSQGRGPLVAILLATIERGNVAVVDKWWTDPQADRVEMFNVLVKAFAERCPAWLSAFEVTVPEQVQFLLEACVRAGLSYVRHEKARFGDHDGVVYSKYLLPNFGG